MRGASLVRVQLYGASFESANLSGANLSKADLTEVNLTNANLDRTILTGATGLTCEHLWRAKNWQNSIRDSELECMGDYAVTTADAGGEYALLRQQAIELIRSLDAAILKYGPAQSVEVVGSEIRIGHNRPPGELELAQEEMREAAGLLNAAHLLTQANLSPSETS